MVVNTESFIQAVEQCFTLAEYHLTKDCVCLSVVFPWWMSRASSCLSVVTGWAILSGSFSAPVTQLVNQQNCSENIEENWYYAIYKSWHFFNCCVESGWREQGKIHLKLEMWEQRCMFQLWCLMIWCISLCCGL